MAFKRIKDWLVSITSFRTGDVIPVDGPSGTAKMSKDVLLQLTAQNALAGNVAPAFDPTKPDDEGGYAYYKDQIVTYQGATYKFKVNHSSGAWNAAEVDHYLAGAPLEFFVVTDNPEYIFAVVDKSERFLFGVKQDGSFEYAKGLPAPVKAYIDYLIASVKLLIEGKVDKVAGKSLIDSVFADAQSSPENPEYVQALTDAAERLLEALDKSGKHIFFNKTKFLGGIDWTESNLADLTEALKAFGFVGGQGDWTDAKSLQIGKPRFAIVNFTNIQSMPTTKTADAQGIMEFWDMQGNFFKKKVIMNAQGNSSLAFVKKNISLDLCNDDWEGDDTFKIKFGDWVSQDSFHLKAFYTDFFRGVGEVGYEIYKSILDTRDIAKDRTWKTALVHNDGNWGQGIGYHAEKKLDFRIDDGALCFPQGFPCAVYLNGEFYGLFAWQLKKHRDNYVMDKKSAKNIHLDGLLGSNFFQGTIDWTAFEIRNPKDLICLDGTTKYDGDNPTEIIGSDSPNYDPTNSKHVLTAQVKAYIITLSNIYSQISAAATTEAKKAIIEAVFDVDNIVDYQIFSDIIQNTDGFAKNWQWTTWDGVKWFVNAYDLDMAFGATFRGDSIRVPLTSMLGNSTAYPSKYIQDYYRSELEARYKELRDGKVLDIRSIVGKLDEWVKKIGLDFYKLEYEKWPDSPCNNDIVVNTDYWIVKVDGEGNPVISYTSTGLYSNSHAYTTGDECVYNPTTTEASQGWYYTFVCVANTTGNKPATSAGIRDNIWRVRDWVALNLSNMDSAYNYQ
jgi:hypothetical protein